MPAVSKTSRKSTKAYPVSLSHGGYQKQNQQKLKTMNMNRVFPRTEDCFGLVATIESKAHRPSLEGSGM